MRELEKQAHKIRRDLEEFLLLSTVVERQMRSMQDCVKFGTMHWT